MSNIARNKKAFFDYYILEQFEAGLELEGSEVKSLRLGKISIKESFVKIVRSEIFLFNAHISHIATINDNFKPDEKRTRKLLLHRKQIDKITGKIAQDGMTVVPLEMYFNSRNMVKIKIALAKGKKLYDKREDLKQKDMKRSIAQSLKEHFR